MKKTVVLLTLIGALSGVRADASAAAPQPLLPPMRTIPAGEFTMGSTEPPIGDGSHNPGERSPHLVRVPSFRLAQYETTVAQFREFVQATGHKTQDQCWQFDRANGIALKDIKWDAPAVAPGEFHPVMCVTWEDANAYVAWLSSQTGRSFRLPSEAEWEYAARAGTTTRYHAGDAPELLCEYANLKDRRFKAATQRDHGREALVTDCDDGAEYTTVVGMYRPNAFGLHDVIGNVAEWVADCQHPDYEGAPVDGSAWTSGCEKERDFYITRGGTYSSSRQVLRSAARGHGGRRNASSLGEGFRIAEDIGGPAAATPLLPDARFTAGLAAAQQAERSRRAGQVPRQQAD